MIFENDRLTKYEGNILYKYYSYNEDNERMYAPLLHNSLRYNAPAELNDPYDCYISSKTSDGNYIDEYNGLMDGIYVLSMTTEVDNILLWSHYASNHQGYVIKYNIDKIFENNTKQIENFYQVKYSESIIKNNYTKLVNSFSITNNTNRSQHLENIIIDAIYNKAKNWDYENEVRSVLYNGTYTLKNIDLEIPRSSIEAITFGSHCRPDNKCINLINKSIPNIKLKKARLNSQIYKIEEKVLTI